MSCCKPCPVLQPRNTQRPLARKRMRTALFHSLLLAGISRSLSLSTCRGTHPVPGPSPRVPPGAAESSLLLHIPIALNPAVHGNLPHAY